MNRYISLLHGINATGTRIIKIDEPASMYESLVLKKVITYIQSGNAIFDTAQGQRREIYIRHFCLIESKVQKNQTRTK